MFLRAKMTLYQAFVFGIGSTFIPIATRNRHFNLIICILVKQADSSSWLFENQRIHGLQLLPIMVVIMSSIRIVILGAYSTPLVPILPPSLVCDKICFDRVW